jgi:hypothetical protein
MSKTLQRFTLRTGAALLAAAAGAVSALDLPEEKKPLAAIGADSSPEAQALRDDLQAKWEEVARAAGIDPAKAAAGGSRAKQRSPAKDR